MKEVEEIQKEVEEIQRTLSKEVMFHNKKALVKDIANKTETEAIKHSLKDTSDNSIEEDYPQSEPTPPTPVEGCTTGGRTQHHPL